MAHYRCKCAIKYDNETGRWSCSVTGCECFYLSPDSKACARDYGEGPESEEQDE